MADVVFVVVVKPSLMALPADENDRKEAGRLSASMAFESCA